MSIFYVESYSGWFLVRAQTKRKAFSEGVREYGRGMVKLVRKATQEEISYFVSHKGDDAIGEAI